MVLYLIDKNDKLKIIEIGIRWGGSVLMWLDFFQMQKYIVLILIYRK